MPAALAHCLFVQDCLERDRVMLPFLHSHRDLVLVGAQGPDPFFFYGRLPWRRRPDRGAVSEFGSWLHDCDPVSTLPRLAAGVLGQRGAERDLLSAYLYGTVLHYVLDRTIHPYVYGRTGFDAQGRLTGQFFVLHAELEAAMDDHLIARRGYRRSDWAPHKLLAADPAKVDAAGLLYSLAFPEEKASCRLSDSWKDMVAIQRIFHDPRGIKRRLVRALGGRRSLPHALMRSPRREDDQDPLNTKQRPWLDPVSGNPRHESVLELYGTALREAAGFIELLSNLCAPDGPGPSQAVPAWETLLRGLNHDGHRPDARKRYSMLTAGR